MTASAIASSIAKKKVEEKRHRQEPAQLVVCLVIAMSLWSKDSMRDVLKNLIDGLISNPPFLGIIHLCVLETLRSGAYSAV
jgi:hypothetical protein